MGYARKGQIMNVNGITKVTSESYKPYQKIDVAKELPAEETNTAEDNGVVYEPTLETPTKTFKANEKVIAQLKLDAQNRMDQLQAIVQQLIGKQCKTADIWEKLKSGELEVDPETRAQAEADIAEDGYFGVKQTSDRIIDFAVALTGGDPSKVEAMRDAFKKGYEQAEKTWGGKLPEICQKTYDAVMAKFDNLAADTQ